MTNSKWLTEREIRSGRACLSETASDAFGTDLSDNLSSGLSDEAFSFAKAMEDTLAKSEALAKEEALWIARAKLPTVGEAGRRKTDSRTVFVSASTSP
jgi:hypothetical protein